MKIALFYHLKSGGALKVTKAIIKYLSVKHQLITIPYSRKNKGWSLLPRRIRADWEMLFCSRRTEEKLANKINQQGFDICIVSHNQHFHAPWILRYLTIPSIFICHEPTRALFEAFLASSRDWPLVNRLYEHLIRFLKREVEINNAKRADLIIADSLFSAESIFRAYGTESTVVYPAVDNQEFHPVKTEKKNQVIVIGNHEPQKGLDFAISVIALIKKPVRPKLIIIGPRQSNLKPLKKMAKKLEVDLATHNNLKISQLRKKYSESLVALATAHLEPFGLSVIESQACGTPVAAVNEGGFRETIIHQKTGLLLSRDTAKFAKSLEKLLSNRQRLNLMGKQYAINQAKKFNWEKYINQLEKAINTVITNHQTKAKSS